ncbi:hypothetical protein EVAR_42564_1 [Eumeta japonica]|uniref:WW domain-containing protein n=1 Tax=Eumeta variegata TaxID=151549 RepID=A0A4C1WUX4_EUMVA|nr:hypothetical protein EVAR_42564_1 [Eumeta japonica]
MSKVNPLAGLIGQYDYSDDDSDEDGFSKTNVNKTDVSKLTPHTFVSQEVETSTIHPAPIPHCAWSACYDESSGFTYYWNQQTNAVTWEAPPEYLLALKLAQQQIHSSGTTEVSAAEWQLYQQALLEKQNTQNKLSIKNNSNNLTSALEKQKSVSVRKPLLAGVKRAVSESDEEKIELITSYYNSDSESNDEAETPKKAHQKSMIKPSLSQKHDFSKPSQKKQKTKSEPIEYGPVLPPNYPPPIDSEQSSVKVSSKNEEPVKDNSDKENKNVLTTEVKTSSDAIEIPENEDAQDDEVLFEKLKDKAKLLEKLGGELPNELKNLIKDEKQSGGMSPDITTKIDETSRDSKSTIDTNIDDLLEEIEKKEMPKKVLSKDKVKIDIFGDDNCEAKSRRGSSEEDKNENNSQEIKSLFPSSKNINEEPIPKVLFPISANIEQNGTVGNHTKTELTKSVVEEKKGANLYIMDSSEVVDHTIRKKLRISSSVLPEKKKSEVPTYTTKYSQFIEGVSSVRTGLGFNENDDTEMELSDRTVNYGKGLVFTKGETLNEEKKVTEETEKSDLDDTMDLLDAKLKYLCQQQTYPMSPIQEMMVQLQINRFDMTRDWKFLTDWKLYCREVVVVGSSAPVSVRAGHGAGMSLWLRPGALLRSDDGARGLVPELTYHNGTIYPNHIWACWNGPEMDFDHD